MHPSTPPPAPPKTPLHLGGSCSTIFAAMQFILYTGVSHVHIVGCDVSARGYSAAAKNKVLAVCKLDPVT